MSAECHKHGTDLLGAGADYCPSCRVDELESEVERLNVEIAAYVEFSDRAYQAEARVQHLEAAIREHKERRSPRPWGDAIDAALYAALDTPQAGPADAMEQGLPASDPQSGDSASSDAPSPAEGASTCEHEWKGTIIKRFTCCCKHCGAEQGATDG